MGGEQERTEQATPKRCERARKEGDQPRSSLAAYAAVAWLAAIPLALAPRMADWWAVAFARCSGADVSTAAAAVAGGFVPGLAIGCVWLCVCVAALASAAACGAVGWSTGALRWRAPHVSSAAGVRSMFSRDALAQTGLTSCAAAGLLLCAVPSVQLLLQASAVVQRPEAVPALARAVLTAFWWRAAPMLSALAVVDVVLARRRHAQRLRMTPREVRDERAEQEGKPEHKARRRSIGLRRNRRLRVAALKRAAALVTNPTHVAVALEYLPPRIDIPVVIAAGAGAGSALLRTAAAFYDVPVIESPDIARALFARVEIDEPIPEDLYAAIAAIFAWILKTRGRLGPSIEVA